MKTGVLYSKKLSTVLSKPNISVTNIMKAASIKKHKRKV